MEPLQKASTVGLTWKMYSTTAKLHSLGRNNPRECDLADVSNDRKKILEKEYQDNGAEIMNLTKDLFMSDRVKGNVVDPATTGT